MQLTQDIMDFEDLLDEEQKKLVEDENPMGVESDEILGDESSETAFEVMRDLMEKFKVFSDACAEAWKIQEIPAPLRKSLITLDQNNQDKYQKMYMMVQKYADGMKEAELGKLK